MSSPDIRPWARAEAASAALESYISAHLHAGTGPARQAGTPATSRARLTALLTGLMHCADAGAARFSFEQALAAGREQYRRYADGMLPARRPRSAAADVALASYHRALAGQAKPRSAEPATITFLARHAGTTLGEAAASLTARLLADLQLYAVLHDLSFAGALSASRSSYAAGLLRQHGPFDPGTDTRQDAALPLPAGAEPFRPLPVCAGVVISCTDAEWLLVRTEARIRDISRVSGPRPATAADIEDRDRLAAVLAAVHGTSGDAILTRLEAAVAGRARDLADGPAAAAALGYQHGITGAYPYARPHEGEELLMAALGETEPASQENAPHRWALIAAYLNAYDRAQRHRSAAPALHAVRDFPRELPEFLPGIAPPALIRQAARRNPPGQRRPLRGL
jgi:hypothetical protein